MKTLKTFNFFHLSIFISLILLLSQSVNAAPDLYKVIFRKGDVSMERGGEKRKVFKGDFLLAGDQVQSGSKGLVILGFGEGYRSRMKVGPMSQLKLEGKKPDREDANEEKTFFFLEVGNILVHYINKNKDKNRLKVKTKSASMGIRGTEFFIHTTENGETLVAVRSGVVLAKHKDKKTGIPLTSEEGVVFTTDGASPMLTPPDWYKHINWKLDATTKEIEELLHEPAIEKVGVDSLVNKMITVKGDELKDSQLQGEPKKWQNQCDKKVAEGCSQLALYLLKNGKIAETKNIVLGLFNKACSFGDSRSCVWVGRVEHEFGNKESGLSHIRTLCEKKSAYACYSLWEIYKSDKSGDEGLNDQRAAEYLQKSLSILHGLEDFDSSLTMFEQACETDNATACLNFGILLEQVDKKIRAKEMYAKGCELGSGAACSNLGYMFQSQQDLDQAKKQYTKACFMDEAYGCYNLSCIYSKEKKIDLSKQYLRMAISGGFNDWATIEEDQDLRNLKADSSYAAFAKSLKSEFKSKPKEESSSADL